MEFNKTDAAIPASSTSAEATSTVAGEIDLYEELKAFAELSPEEQRRLAERLENAAAEKASQSLPAEPVLTQLPMLEAADAPFPRRAVESVSVYQGSKEPVEAHPRPFEISNTSGPLTELSSPLLFTGALSRGVCLACGAESGVDDLFCITCGIFIDEVGSTQPPNPTCAECNLRIVADEIFCPGCGSLLPAETPGQYW